MLIESWAELRAFKQQFFPDEPLVRMNCDVVISGGLGCSIMPFRLGVPPEIVLVTLGGAATSSA